MLKAKNCKRGQAQFEYFINVRGDKMVQYDYRTEANELFSCVAKSLDDAIAKRDEWLIQIEADEWVTR